MAGASKRYTVSSDEHTALVDLVLDELKDRGHEAEYFGPHAGEEDADWPDATRAAVTPVAEGRADGAIVMCWTGTGASIAANKVRGVRAALCSDAETAKGSRIYNHANALALSLRATPLPIAKEILAAWLDTPPGEDDWNKAQVEKIGRMEQA